MGRLHKKKLAEYAGESDELNKSNEKDGQKNATVESGSESEEDHETNAGKKAAVNEVAHSGEEDEEDFKSLQGDESAQDGEKDARKPHKRKAAEKATKNDTEGDSEGSDDEPLSGGSSPKKGRKAAAGKGKAPPKNGKAGAGGRKAKKPQKKQPQDDEEEDDGEGEVEEEYEVKEIVDHKVERGVSYFLIRWKGYTKEDDTWEAEETLSCPDIIEKYKKKSPNGKSEKKGAVTPKKGRTAAKEDPNKEWEVDKIIDYAEEKGGRTFRIRWKGFGPKHDTWEPEENLYCDEIIDKFMKRMKTQENVSFKELREEPKKTKRLVNETAPRTNYTNKIGRSSKRAVTRKRVYYGDSDE